MWVSRDESGHLNMFIDKPTRLNVHWVGLLIGSLSIHLYHEKGSVFEDFVKGFENLTWKDEPVEVSLTIINKIT